MSEADLIFPLLPEEIGGEDGNETSTKATATKSLTWSSEETNEGLSSTENGWPKADENNDSLCKELSELSQSGHTEHSTLKLNEILEQIEHKINFFKGLQGAGNGQCEINLGSKSSDVSSKVNNATLEEMFEDIQKIDTKDNIEHVNLFTEVQVLIKILVTIQNAMLSILDNTNLLQNEFQGINVLATLIRHLSVNVGSKVTFEEVRKYINVKKSHGSVLCSSKFSRAFITQIGNHLKIY